jgi:hypothetical protein
MHPAVDMAYNGGVTWSDASTFLRNSQDRLSMGGRVYPGNVSSTDIYARINASEQCKGRDIILMNTPWTVPLNFTEARVPFIPQNQLYQHSPSFRMRGLLCESQYFMSTRKKPILVSGSPQQNLDANLHSPEPSEKVPDGLLDLRNFQTQSMQDNWRTYFDVTSLLAATPPIDPVGDIRGTKSFPTYPKFSGMGPLLAALSNYNLTSMLDDPEIVQKAAAIKGRFFTETIRETFNDPQLLETGVVRGEATIVETRIVVLREIGLTLAALFFTSTILLILIFWNSRLAHRPLHLQSDPASTVGLSLLLDRRNSALSTLRSMHQASSAELYTALQGERYLTANNVLLRGDDDNGRLK